MTKKNQSDKFKDLAREVEADESEKAYLEALKKMGYKSTPKGDEDERPGNSD